MRAFEAEGLINTCFSVQPGQSFYDDFPVWRPDAGVGSWVETHYENGVIAAVAHGRMSRLRIGEEIYSVGIIGAVATDPALRGRGLGRRVVEGARDRLLREGARFVVLWGSDRNWYARMGFQPAGTQNLVPLADLELSVEAQVGLDLRGHFSESIFRRMQETRARFGGLALTDQDLGWMSRHRNVRWFSVCETKSSEVLAYAAVGRGIDLGGVVHEWGGAPAALRALLATFRQEAPHLLMMSCPEALASLSLVKNSERVLADPAALVYWAQEQDAHTLGPRLWLWGLDSA